jgi:membrane-associated protease RseP (regulator of RpoE activity)
MDESPPTRRPSRVTALLVIALLAALILRDPAQAIQIAGTILLGMGLLTVISVIHELAHALTARAVGVKVREFGIFFPPRFAVLGTVRGVVISLNWIPLGGFTRLEGEKEATGPGSFKAASLPRRLAIILAGPLSNFVLAYLVFLAWGLFDGGHPAYEIPWRALQALGITITTILAGLAAIPAAFLADPSNPPVVGLPGIVVVTGQAAQFGPRSLLILFGLLSTSVGVLNVLPLPPLDGGAALVAVVERFAGGRAARAVTALTAAGLFFIVALALIANLADVVALLFGTNRFGS